MCRVDSLTLLPSENLSPYVFPHPSSESFTVSAFYNIKLNIFLSQNLLPSLTNISLVFPLPLVSAHFADNFGECYLVRALSPVEYV